MILGAVLAGGQSRRFGSDKAVADIAGEPMIERVVATLVRQCDAVAVCGRSWRDLPEIADRPHGGLGPLAGLAGALAYADCSGFDTVLVVPCDVPDLPDTLLSQLTPAPALVRACPVIGAWPTSLLSTLDDYLSRGGRRSMRAWGEAVSVREVDLDRSLTNINQPGDLAGFLASADRAQAKGPDP